MLPLIAALALAASQTPTAEPPTTPTPEAPVAGEGDRSTIVEIHTIKRTSDGSAPPPVARVAVCDGRKFEFQASTGEGKEKHNSRIVLCSEKGASNERMVAMLEDAAKRLESSELPEANKGKIIADVQAKAAELKAAN